MSEGQYHTEEIKTAFTTGKSSSLIIKACNSVPAPETFPIMLFIRWPGGWSRAWSDVPAGNGCGPHIGPVPSFQCPSFSAPLSPPLGCLSPPEPETSFPDWPGPGPPPSVPADAPPSAAAPPVSAPSHGELCLQNAGQKGWRWWCESVWECLDLNLFKWSLPTYLHHIHHLFQVFQLLLSVPQPLLILCLQLQQHFLQVKVSSGVDLHQIQAQGSISTRKHQHVWRWAPLRQVECVCEWKRMQFGMLESQSDTRREDNCWNRSLSAQQQAFSNGTTRVVWWSLLFFCKFNMKTDYCLQKMSIFCHITLVADKAAHQPCFCRQ